MQLRLDENRRISSLRTTPELRQAAEQILQDGGSLSSFVEQAIRESIGRRQLRQKFIVRGRRSRDEARLSGKYVATDSAIGRRKQMLASANGKK